MILRFYMDVAGGTAGHYTATTMPPPTKPVGFKRIAFEVDIPDEALVDADYYFPVEATKPKKKSEPKASVPDDTPTLEAPGGGF